MKKKIALLFGGRSGEHEVSVVGARGLYATEEVREYYDFTLIGIDRDGRMRVLDVFPAEPALSFAGEELIPNDVLEALYQVDIAFPLLHGPYGEDGKIQGFLATLGVPYIGCGVLASSLLMDKDMAKRLMQASGIPVVPWVALKKEDEVPSFTYPVFVKPANLGSSLGVSKVNEESELAVALDLAFTLDKKVLVENAVVGRELECSILGEEVSGVGEIIPTQEFYTYDAKYIDASSQVVLPAEISEEVEEKIRYYTDEVRKIFSIKDLSRVDFFYSKEGEIYLNEVNTLPGFTPISMYTKLWTTKGWTLKEILDLWTQEV